MTLEVGSLNTPATIEQTRQGWFPVAWRAFDEVGEVKGGGRFMESAASRVIMSLGIIPGLGEDPVPLHEAAERGLISGAPNSPELESAQEDAVVTIADVAIAEMLVEGITQGQEGEGALLGSWALKSFVVGEAYIVGYVDPETLEEVWLCLSSEEVVKDESARGSAPKVLIRRSGTALTSSGTTDAPGLTDVRLPDDAVLLRIWRRHGRFGDLSDSNLHGCLTECEELRVLDASIKATALSRIPAGILAISEDIEPKPVALEPDEDDDTENPAQDPLLVEIVKHMSIPIQDPGSASAAVPFLMRLPSRTDAGTSARDLAFMIETQRALDPEVVNRCQYLRGRIGATLELPSSDALGTGAEANHWTGWLIDEERYRLYVAPTLQPLFDGLTIRYLRKRLVASGVDVEAAKRFVLYGDPKDLTTRPNRVDNAVAGHTGLAISNEAFRSALGFGDDDAPTPEEIFLRVISRQTVLPDAVVPLLNQIFGTDFLTPAIETTSDGGTPAPPGGNELPAGEAGSEGSGSGDVPTTNGDVPVTAAATSSQRRKAQLRLMTIDRRLRERLLVAADSTVSRTVERAGAKLRSSMSAGRAGSMRSELRHEMVSVSNRRLLSTVGRERIIALGVEPDDLFSTDFDDLEDRWDDWLAGAQDDVVATASRSLGVDPDGEAISRYRMKADERSKAGWLFLSGALLTLARRTVFDPTPTAELGEVDSTLVPAGTIRFALSVAGGNSPVKTASGGVRDGSTDGYAGGFSTGDDVAALWGAEGQPWSGFEWIYNDEGQKTFDPHLVLGSSGPDGGGVQYSADDDPILSTAGTGAEWIGDFFFVGDHSGCRCDAVPIWGS
jgi:hypothetical protein